MKVSAKQLSSVIAKLYDAALRPELWNDFLRDVAELTHGDSAAVVIQDYRDQLHNVYQQANIPSEALEQYQEHFGKIDVWSARGEYIKNTTWLGTSEMLCPFNELEGTEYFNDFLRRHDMSHALFSFIERTPTRVMNLSVYRGSKAGEFPEWGVELMALLQPHLKRALVLNTHLTKIEHRSQSLALAADASFQKILFLSSTGKITFANKGALALLSREDGLKIQSDRLRSGSLHDDARLQKLIREAADTANGLRLAPGGCISISRNGGPDIQVLITPLPQRMIPAEGAAMVIFVVDPADRIPTRHELLQTAFGLTMAEARVACIIASGLSLEQIATELAITRNTLKTQLANLYLKIGVSKQHQLTRVILQFPQS
jgi:DNA-binding CsgD family transcriptional regulator